MELIPSTQHIVETKHKKKYIKSFGSCLASSHLNGKKKKMVVRTAQR
jgi:hypothetical protein